MTERTASWPNVRKWIVVIMLAGAIIGVWWTLVGRDLWPRSEALSVALSAVISDEEDTDQSLVARVILDNYLETRGDASRWSGVYWGFTFVAAVLSAAAGLILKLETLIRNEGMKKDVAAVCAVAAALLITISTSGDFQRKWQANRLAAAELEQTGYDFLEKGAADPRSYLGPVGQVLLRRNMAIVGGSEQKKTEASPAQTSSPAGIGGKGNK
jgi:hypothetical protein